MAAATPTRPAVTPAAPVPLIATADDAMTRGTVPVETLDRIQQQLNEEKTCRDTINEHGRALLPQAQRAQHTLLTLGAGDTATGLLADCDSLAKLLVNAEPEPRRFFIRGHGVAATAIEHWVSGRCHLHFFKTGTLLERSAFPELDDQEYLSGAISFCHELGRYAVNQATFGNAESILLCRSVCSLVQGKLLEFDFRNGPLRRKYDGLKYAAKRLDDLLYELSLTGAYVAAEVEEGTSSATKRRRTDSALTELNHVGGVADGAPLVRVADFDEMNAKMAAFDAAREDVIKRTRDVQKLSKQAIFSLHRDGLSTAAEQLTKAADLAKAIWDDRVAAEPLLRNGSYTNSLEEYAEGMLFLCWLESGTIIGLEDPRMQMLSPSEYLGGLVDFTGEVGRYAVAAASRRDQLAVQKSLAAALAVQDAIMYLGLPSKLSKKEQALRNNVKKMEHVLYELSLVKASGRNVSAATTEESSGRPDDE